MKGRAEEEKGLQEEEPLSEKGTRRGKLEGSAGEVTERSGFRECI